MAVSLFASCAPKLLQKSHAITNLTNQFLTGLTQIIRLCVLSDCHQRGVVEQFRGTCCSTELVTSHRRRALHFPSSPSCPGLHTALQQAQGKCIRFTSIHFHVVDIQVLFLVGS